MNEERQKRFFVTITVPERRSLDLLTSMDLDLFGARADERGRHVDALVTLEEVGKLVEAGCRVLVSDTDEPKRKHEPIAFEDWRKETLADLERQQRKA
jgi:hypothetical protein